MGIHGALSFLFNEPSRRYEWMSKPNTAFAGQSALHVIMAEPQSGLERVHGYLRLEVFENNGVNTGVPIGLYH